MIRTAVRRTAAALTLATLLGVAFVAAGGSASADTPVPGGGWEAKPPVNDAHAYLLFVGIPVLVLLVISALVFAPAIVRGESIRPGSTPAPEGQWIGGPRKAAGELAEPDTADSAAGGAGGTW
ncbi:hypothetical protein [Nocardioides montaniterrae]